MVGKLFVFDLDDTLMDNVHDYAMPILDMARTIVEALGNMVPHVCALINLEEEIDKRRRYEINPDTGKPFLYSMERFPGTCVEVYREVARRAKVATDSAVEKRLYEIGMSAFDEKRYKKNVRPEVLPIFEFLRRQSDLIALLTAGDERVQVKKIEALRKAGVWGFSLIRVADRKTTDIFREIANDLFALKFYTVGNNYRSDIAPALEAGFSGILIPVETWEVLGKMDEVLAEVDRTRCMVLKSLADLPKIYGDLG